MNDSLTVFLFAKNVDLSVSYATEFCEFFLRLIYPAVTLPFG